jgi:lipopolysaccharide biosynthesis glycosyltransferase
MLIEGAFSKATKAPAPVHIVYAPDARYAAYAGISIASIIRRLPREWVPDLHFHLLSDGITRREFDRIRQVTAEINAPLSLHEMRDWLNQDLNFLKRDFKHLTRGTYSRLFITEVLPRTIDRVIYLDCDTIVTSDIGELARITHGMSSPVAACANRDLTPREPQIGMGPTTPYFNCGVLVIDLAAWRRENIGARLVDIATRFPECRFQDQDVLNLAFAGRFMPLPQNWNFQIIVGATPSIPDDVRVIHYCGKQKPWHFRYAGPGADQFHTIKRQSPWRYKIPELPGLRRPVRRFRRSIRKRTW